jgi:hypothetical protein
MPSSVSAPAPKPAAKKPNLLPIIIVVVIIVVAIAAFAFLKGGAKNQNGTEKFAAISSQDAGSKLVSFINEIYGQQIGQVTLKTVTQENGLYKATITLTENGQPVDQNVYISQDGKLFLPQAIVMEDALTQFQALKQQQQAQPQGTAGDVNADTNPTPTPAPEATQ